jgi:hypothetical protein
LFNIASFQHCRMPLWMPGLSSDVLREVSSPCCSSCLVYELDKVCPLIYSFLDVRIMLANYLAGCRSYAQESIWQQLVHSLLGLKYIINMQILLHLE